MLTQTYKIPRFVISNRRSTPEGAKVNVCEISQIPFLEIPRRSALSG